MKQIYNTANIEGIGNDAILRGLLISVVLMYLRNSWNCWNCWNCWHRNSVVYRVSKENGSKAVCAVRFEITNTRTSRSNYTGNNDRVLSTRFIVRCISIRSTMYPRFAVFAVLFFLAVCVTRGIQVFGKQNRFPQEISRKLDEYWNSYKVYTAYRTFRVSSELFQARWYFTRAILIPIYRVLLLS